MTENDNQSVHKTGRLSPRTNKAKGSDPHASEIKPQKGSDEVLGAIEGVEKQLNALRDAHDEQRRLSDELADRRAQIEDTAEQIEARESELTGREVELAEMREELESRETEIAQRASGLEQRESKVAQHAESIEELEVVVENKSKQIDQRVEELDKQLQGISIRKEELGKLEKQAKERIELDNKLEADIAALTEDLDHTKASLGGREIELKERAKVVEDLAVQAGLLEKKMAQLSDKSRADEDESLKMVDEMQNQLDDAQQKIHEHDDAMLRAFQRIDELEQIATTRADDLLAAKNTITKLNSVEQAYAESAKQIVDLQSKLEGFQSKFQAAQTQLKSAPSDDQLKGIQSKLDQSAGQLTKAREHATDLQKQLDALGSSATDELETSKSQIAKLTADLAQAKSGLKDAIESRKQTQADLQSKLDAAIKAGKQHQSSSGSHQSAIKELESKLAQRNEQVSAIRSKYDGISEQLLTEQKNTEELEAQIERLGELLDVSNDRENELAQEIVELNELLESAESQEVVKSDEWTSARKERLSRVKSILRIQSDKIRRATGALRDRYDQCEKVLLKRSELVDAYQAISEAQAKLAKREARSGTLLGLSGLGLLLMMIAGGSWFVAGQVVPGAYASRITLTARAGERVMTTDDIASWQGYIEGLVTDPQFIEKAALGMKRRGIDELAIAGNLGAHMSESLDVVSAEPGKIELEYRGDGPARTQRILDTYALTLTSQANAARARRIDGALTSIIESASVGESPLDTARIETAGMIFGGSSLATFIFGGLFWRRMVKLKANFERDSRVEPLFDDNSWEVEGKDA
ncbi:MAG: hypothetical protein JKY43_08740 [Phycisphaerales bacterium]|nr:hypothetical protein [Phycisphaerales bacterium]